MSHNLCRRSVFFLLQLPPDNVPAIISHSQSGNKDDNIILATFGAQKTDRVETAQQVGLIT
jgi:hypothetical protein